MPQVGNKHFAYTAKGQAAAKAASAASGKPVVNAKPAAAGSRSAPSAKASPMAAQRSHGQQGAAMRAAHAQPKASAPSIQPMRQAGKSAQMKPAKAPAKRR